MAGVLVGQIKRDTAPVNGIEPHETHFFFFLSQLKQEKIKQEQKNLI